jgi:hypothetical protein
VGLRIFFFALASNQNWSAFNQIYCLALLHGSDQRHSFPFLLLQRQTLSQLF